MRREKAVKKGTVKVLEKEIQKQIINYLNLHKIFNFKCNTTGIFVQKRNTWIKNPSKGAPDIICIINGIFVGIEVKAQDGIQSDEQKEFERKITLAGGKYILAHSLQELVWKLGYNPEGRFMNPHA